jgi:hypothetical protein
LIFLHDLKMTNWEAAVEKYGDNLSEGLEFYCTAMSKLSAKEKKSGARPDNYIKWLTRMVTTECILLMFL